MKVADLLESRREQWNDLEALCFRMEGKKKNRGGPSEMSRFAALYRSACADLALADSYELPPKTVQYLHQLVGRAHNQLYRSRNFEVNTWAKVLLVEVPQQIFSDLCVQTAFCLFWGVFILSAFLAATPEMWPDFAEKVIGAQMLDMMDSMHSDSVGGRGGAQNQAMAAFYIKHNTGIGLNCFAGGLLVVPGILTTIFNACYLGSVFGYMARPEVASSENFYEFVTAHGPFELTAIILSAGAGLRLGMGWLKTDGMTRSASLVRSSKKGMPIMGAAMLLFFFAALIEGFVSPSALPYALKAAIAVISSGLLMFYFVVLGFPQDPQNAT